MKTTPRLLRLHIRLLGQTNVGKSSFLNFVVGQDVAITSPIPGTTTDVVEKEAELLPVEPVTFLDTGGFDDPSALGKARRVQARKALECSDIVTMVVEPNVWMQDEEWIEAQAERLCTPIVVVLNCCDTATQSRPFPDRVVVGGRPLICCSA